MSEAPYTPSLISRLLRNMPADRLASVTPRNFQLWPVAKKIVPSRIVNELIANERARRAS